ncbi:CHAT domain-containing protein [Spirulina major]|uniref:CHAT domain-containing protein n=1 Tax=Spirulina major TaxID=270636 RepID=UPI0011147D21|nr:CHAT domain-containing protein [Spirulina major]
MPVSPVCPWLRLALVGSSLITLQSPPSLAQSITPAADGTGSVVTQSGDLYQITGGTLSGDGANLFHSLEQLGLNPNEIAQFLAQPQIQNILARVTGGSPSVLQGLVQVLGGGANLYLINPAGIVFTPTAQIDVPGSFTATTSDRIQFGDRAFNATGANNYSTLTGNPTAFEFLRAEPGAILNEAQLSNLDGDINLIGGTVINLGTLEAPNGQITLAAVPGRRTLRITQAGTILAIEIPLSQDLATLTPASLQSLLQLPSFQSADRVTVDDQGVVRISGSDLTITAGDTAILGITKGKMVQIAGAGLIVPDPDAVITAGETSAPTVIHFAENPDDPNALVFLDATVADYQSLLYKGKPGTTTVVVTPDQSGIATITNTLAPRQGVDELHLVTEGNAGEIWLGRDYVSAANVAEFSQQLQAWSASLSEGADLLLYSCFTALGSVGDALLASLAAATGADVAASTDVTGSAALGGNWTLEKTVGTVEAGVAFEGDAIALYPHTLDNFTVTTTADSGTGSLRDMVDRANLTSGVDTIRFLASVLASEIWLTSGPVNIDTTADGLTITNFLPGSMRIRRASASDFRLFNITGPNPVTLENLTLRFGNVGGSENGGGIQSTGGGSLTLNQVTLERNTSANSGGGIFSDGPVTLNNSTIKDNAAGNRGGGLNAPTVTLNNSTLIGNRSTNDGGGIATQILTATDSRIQGNTSDTDGGGIASNTSGILTGTVVSDNQALGRGGGIYNSGTFTLSTSTISSNTATHGGGVWSDGDLSVVDSTISSNTATHGGGLYSLGGPLALNNSTVSGNQASQNGGGITNSAFLSLIHSTIAFNTADADGNGLGEGGGLYQSAGTANITNTIVVNNTGQNGNLSTLSGSWGGSTIQSSLLDSDAGANGLTLNTGLNQNIIGVDPMLSPLGNYGGPTQTHALSPTSVAVDAAQGSQLTDQRGASRVGTPDLGAYESMLQITQAGGDQSAIVDTAFGAPLTVTARDAFQFQGVAGLSVTLEIPASGASLQTMLTGVTGADGTVTFNPVANTIVGSYTVQASMTDLGISPLPFSLTNTPASAVAFTVQESLTTMTAGTSQDVTVTALDLFGNVDTNFSDPLTLSSTDPTASQITGGNLTAGAGTFEVTLRTAGNQTVTATSGAIAGNSGQISVTAAAPSQLAIASGNNQFTSINQAFPQSLTVKLSDLFGNPISGNSIEFAAPTTGASGTPLLISVLTDAQGIAFTPLTANQESGAFQVTATAIASQLTAIFSLLNTLPIVTSVLPSLSVPSPALLFNSPQLGQVPQGFNNPPLPPASLPNRSGQPSQAPPLAPGAQPGQPPQPGRGLPPVAVALAPDVRNAPPQVEQLEQGVNQPFIQHLNLTTFPPPPTPQQVQNTLQTIESQTQEKPALVYAFFKAPGSDPEPKEQAVLWRLDHAYSPQGLEELVAPSGDPQPTDELELVVVMGNGTVLRRRVPEAVRSQVLTTMRQLRRTVINPDSQGFLGHAQVLHQWLIDPITAELEAAGITNLTFILDHGLRSIPWAALHDGEQFLIENYSLAIMPSLSLTDTAYRPLNRPDILAMGASDFQMQAPLPGVPTELAAITNTIAQSQSFLNEGFTLANLQTARQAEAFQIVHLATHGEFRPGSPDNSYIQFWRERLPLSDFPSLQFNNPPVDLLVLSACQTAVGDPEAELGFAGLAVLAGVRSVLGSLWSVSDAGTLGLMTTFYQELSQLPIKSEALRQAQLAMLRGQIRIEAGRLITPSSQIPLPQELQSLGDRTLTHPYFWSAFTMIGNPW